MMVRAELFFRWALQLSKVATDSKEQMHQIWVVPAPFCAVQYINYRRFLLGDENSMKSRMMRSREANVDFRAGAVRSEEDCRKQRALQIVSLRAGENLSVDTENKYSFR